MAAPKLSAAQMRALLEGPAHRGHGATSASWTPNVHSPLQQISYYTCVCVCATVSGILVILRMHTKVNMVQRLDLSDCKALVQIIVRRV
jgi:hypothetical protein